MLARKMQQRVPLSIINVNNPNIFPEANQIVDHLTLLIALDVPVARFRRLSDVIGRSLRNDFTIVFH
jgi:hypothetical protein